MLEINLKACRVISRGSVPRTLVNGQVLSACCESKLNKRSVKCLSGYFVLVDVSLGTGGARGCLDDLPAVPYSATQHHTEDHPDNHDSSNADADIPNDVEFIVEEILDACLTILGTWFRIRTGVS